MNRIPHRSDFRLRLAFSDADGLPVSMAGVETDLWFYTRPGGTAYFAANRDVSKKNCEVLDDGSIVVSIDDHHLPSGQLKCEINIHAADETIPDCKRDIVLKPAIPIELTDSPNCPSPGKHVVDLQQPILLNITIPISRPNISRHITFDELHKTINDTKKELSEVMRDADIALSERINNIRECLNDVASEDEINSIIIPYLIKENV